MNSFNHYAYGAIGHWLYSVVAGLQMDDARPGYKHALIQPLLGGDLAYARAELLTGYGQLACHWHLADAALIVAVTIPPNTTATVVLPTTDTAALAESGRPLEEAAGLRSSRIVEGKLHIEAGNADSSQVTGRISQRLGCRRSAVT